MFVIYDPEDGNKPQEWEFDPEDVLRKEAQAIEKVYGQAWEAWLNGLRTREVKARTVLLWHLMRRDHPKLRFEDVPDFRMRQMRVELGVAELRALRDTLLKTKMSDDTREAVEAAMDRDITEAMEREATRTGVYEGEVEQEPPALPKAL